MDMRMKTYRIFGRHRLSLTHSLSVSLTANSCHCSDTIESQNTRSSSRYHAKVLTCLSFHTCCVQSIHPSNLNAIKWWIRMRIHLKRSSSSYATIILQIKMDDCWIMLRNYLALKGKSCQAPLLNGASNEYSEWMDIRNWSRQLFHYHRPSSVDDSTRILTIKAARLLILWPSHCFFWLTSIMDPYKIISHHRHQQQQILLLQWGHH